MNPLLQVEAVNKAFGGNQVLQGVDFTLQSGEILGLLGPNGSGKSTLLNVISGFVPIDAGAIRVQGNPIHHLPTFQIIKTGVARTFQLPAMPEKMSVLEVVMAADTRQHGFWANLLGMSKVKQAEQSSKEKAQALLDELLLSHVRDLPAAALSGGQKKLLGIACALMGKPSVLMLDEPMAGVHPNLRRDLVETLKRLNRDGLSIVVIEHDMHFIRELCQRCIVLDRGQIVADCRPDELADNEQVLEAYLGKSNPHLKEVV